MPGRRLGEVLRKVKTSCMEGGEGGPDPMQETLHDSVKQQPHIWKDSFEIRPFALCAL